MRFLFTCLLVLSLACNGDEEARNQRQTAERARRAAEKMERQRLRTEAMASVRSSLASLGANPDAQAVQKACEPGFVAHALKSDPQVAETCSAAYLELARKEIRRRDPKKASSYIEQQRSTGIKSADVSDVKDDLWTLVEKERAKTRAREEARVRRAGEGANPADWRQAQDFLAELPPACAASRASVSSDGSVLIRLICHGAQQSMHGSVRIKDGLVTEIH